MEKCELAEGCRNYDQYAITCNVDGGKFGPKSYCRILILHEKGKNPAAIDYSKITKKTIFK